MWPFSASNIFTKAAFDAAYVFEAFGCAVWPDTIMSDGFVAAMQRWVAAGYHLVMQPTVRLSEEGVLADLKTIKLLPESDRLSLTAAAIVVPSRLVADLSVRHLHPELEIMGEGHPLQPLYPPYRFWRVPDRRGIILHVFFATPVLLDFAAVPADHTACLEERDWESIYIGRNFTAAGGLYVVADFDESGILSITPAAVDRSGSRRTSRLGARWMPQFALLCNLRGAISAYTRGERDLIRRDMFRVSVRWHADDVDDVWRQEEAAIMALIDRAAGDYYSHGPVLPPRLSFDPRYLPFDLFNVLQGIARVVGGGAAAGFGALTGNRADAELIKRKANALRSTLIRRLRLR